MLKDIYNPTDLKWLIEHAEQPKDITHIKGSSIIFIPENELNEDGYVSAHRFVKVQTSAHLYLIDGSYTDSSFLFHGITDVKASKQFMDFVPNGVQIWFPDYNAIYDCSCYSSTTVYLTEK